MNLDQRLRRLETERQISGEIRSLRLVISNYGPLAEGQHAACIRTSCSNGVVMELVDLRSRLNPFDGEAREQWIASLPIRGAAGQRRITAGQRR